MEILENVKGWRTLQGSDDAGDPDVPLLRAAQRGNRSAMGALFARHEKAVGTVCYGVLGNREDAEDAAQEAFIQAMRGLPGFRSSSTFRTWLYRIAVNTCLNHKRRWKPTERWQDVNEQHAQSHEAGTLSRIFAADALAQLLPRQRAIIVMREVQGMSAEEIGRAMGWNEQKVRNELFKARQVLRQWLRAQGQEDGE